MARYFNTLSAAEIQTLRDTFSYITLLVASADESLTREEREEAINTIRVRGFEANHIFFEFYNLLELEFTNTLDKLSAEIGVSRSLEDRYAREIAHVNPILSKLPASVARRLYKDYLSFAHRIANASGGIFGFGTISKEERSVMSLPMIVPIADQEEE